MSTLDVLKAAAEQVATEGQQEAEEVLLVTAEKIASASNINLNCSIDIDGSLELVISNKYDNSNQAPLLLERTDEGKLVEAKIDENVVALMNDMNIKPKSIDDDVDALLTMQKQKEESESEEEIKILPKKDSWIKDNYLRTSQKFKLNKKKTKRTKKLDCYSAEPSRISVMLSEAEDREWQRRDEEEEKSSKDYHNNNLYDRILKSELFKNPRQEMLFRTMKVVRPKTARDSNKAKTLSSSAYQLPSSKSYYNSTIAESKSYTLNTTKEIGSVSRYLKASTTTAFQSSVLLNDTYAEAKSSAHKKRIGSAGLDAKSLSAADADYLLDLHTCRTPALNKTERLRQQQYVEHIRSSAHRLSSTDGNIKGKPSRLDIQFDPTLKYGTLSDAKECTFMPNAKAQQKKKLRRKNNNDSDDDEHKDEQARQYAFINRQEAEERNRRDELEFQQGKAKYDCRVDKKACPSCGAKQSYDEYKEKRKFCPNCKVEYCPKISWEKVGNKFLKNNKNYVQNNIKKTEKLRKELDDELNVIEKIKYNNKKIVKEKIRRKQYLTTEEEEDFYNRLAMKLSKRDEAISKLEEEIYVKPYTFTPTISKFAQERYEEIMEEQEEDSDIDPGEAFIKRYYNDLEERQEKYPQKYLKQRYNNNDNLEPFKITTASTYKRNKK